MMMVMMNPATPGQKTQANTTPHPLLEKRKQKDDTNTHTLGIHPMLAHAPNPQPDATLAHPDDDTREREQKKHDKGKISPTPSPSPVYCALLASNNARLNAVSFSPTFGVGSLSVSHLRY